MNTLLLIVLWAVLLPLSYGVVCLLASPRFFIKDRVR